MVNCLHYLGPVLSLPIVYLVAQSTISILLPPKVNTQMFGG